MQLAFALDRERIAFLGFDRDGLVRRIERDILQGILAGEGQRIRDVDDAKEISGFLIHLAGDAGMIQRGIDGIVSSIRINRRKRDRAVERNDVQLACASDRERAGRGSRP